MNQSLLVLVLVLVLVLRRCWLFYGAGRANEFSTSIFFRQCGFRHLKMRKALPQRRKSTASIFSISPPPTPVTRRSLAVCRNWPRKMSLCGTAISPPTTVCEPAGECGA